jgi:hypothetical protein
LLSGSKTNRFIDLYLAELAPIETIETRDADFEMALKQWYPKNSG